MFLVQQASENIPVLTELLLTQDVQCQENYCDFFALMQTTFTLLFTSSTMMFFYLVCFQTFDVRDLNKQAHNARINQTVDPE